VTTTSRERSATGRGLEWDERSLVPDRAGVPWWAAVLLALVLTTAGAFVDMERINRLGIVFQACYFIGCLLAVAVVQRRGLFGPMVQPPLILAGAVPGVVLLTGSIPQDGGTAAAALVVGTPLINGFPTMATTTIVTVIVGVFRLVTQRPPHDDADPPRDQTADPPRDQPRPSPRRRADSDAPSPRKRRRADS
jgi:hypothetical protein